MPGAIGLVGGEEFRRGCEEMDREIMRASGEEPAPGSSPGAIGLAGKHAGRAGQGPYSRHGDHNG